MTAVIEQTRAYLESAARQVASSLAHLEEHELRAWLEREGEQADEVGRVLIEATLRAWREARGPLDPVEAGARLRLRRLGAGLSQGELARRAGVSRSTIKNAEHGTHHPEPATLAAIKKVLG